MNIGKVARATERAQGRAEVVNNGDRTALERNPIVVELLFKSRFEGKISIHSERIPASATLIDLVLMKKKKKND